MNTEISYYNMKQFQTSIYENFPPFGTCLYHKQNRPQTQNFLEMLRFTFFPYLQLYTFTFFWLMTVIFVFVYSLYWDQEDGHKTDVEEEFLKVSQNALFQLGENYPYFIVNKYHFYRMLTSMVLFRNLYHFLMGAIGIAIFASYIEEIVGFKRIFLLAVTCGVGGELIRNVFIYKASIESITPICGLIGYMLGLYLERANNQWKYYQKQRMHMLIIMLIVITLYLQLGYYYRNISQISMIAAMFIGYVFYFCDPQEQYIKWKIIAIGLLVVIIGLAAFLMFFKIKPELVIV